MNLPGSSGRALVNIAEQNKMDISEIAIEIRCMFQDGGDFFFLRECRVPQRLLALGYVVDGEIWCMCLGIYTVPRVEEVEEVVVDLVWW